MILDRHKRACLDCTADYALTLLNCISVDDMDNKKAPAVAGAPVLQPPCCKTGGFIGAYGSSPEASISASSIAPGEHMMLMKVAPVSLATIGRCGQLMAIRNRANRA